MKITVNNVELFYEVAGSGTPLVMVHGNGEDHTVFDKAAELLSQHFTCYLLDSRGHGSSQKVSEFHYDDMAEDVYQFIQALHLEHVIYYGFSDGGIIGLLLAVRHPGLLDKMIISGANTRPDAVRRRLVIMLRIINRIRKNPLLTLMLTEPHISEKQLQAIDTPTLVLAGSKDLILEKDTRFIAEHIPGASLRILEGEGHGSYIVHKTRVAELILEYCGKA
ncbi:MAG: alpha/beta hydrolase [Lachnospiraceae bacterium]|nr:alpha/beta hydrolase [Lachnospiraceae bacterium]